MKLEPFLPALSMGQRDKVDAWIPVLELLLNGRYGDRITAQPSGTDPAIPANEPVFVSAAADAISRRLTKPAGLIDSQTIGPASVRYNSRAGLSQWFLPEELAQLDGALGIGSIRSVRTPAPDGVRFGNRMHHEAVDF